MKGKNKFYCFGILLSIAANCVQAASPQDTVELTPLFTQPGPHAPIDAQRPSGAAQLSFNQNRRLSFEEGLSIDSALPSFSLGRNTQFSGFSRLNETEQHLAAGLKFGNSQINIMRGRGEGFSRLSNQYSHLDPYYFHGGTTAKFKFNTVEWTHQLNNKFEFQLGQANIDAERLERRRTQYIATRFGKVSAQYMKIDRGHTQAGEALNLSLETAPGSLIWSALRHAGGGQIQQISFGFNSKTRNQFGIGLREQHNPLNEDDGGYRVMFSFQRDLGSGYRMRATDKPANANPKINKLAIFGGGAVIVGFLASSGSDNQDSTVRLADQHAAAKQVLNDINPRSVRENVEFGGWIYKTPDDRYTSTQPIRGQKAGISLPLSLIPSGGKATASYHTHGGNDPEFVNEQFSPADIRSNEAFKVDGYLATPFGKFVWYNNRSNSISLLGEVANK